MPRKQPRQVALESDSVQQRGSPHTPPQLPCSTGRARGARSRLSSRLGTVSSVLGKLQKAEKATAWLSTQGPLAPTPAPAADPSCSRRTWTGRRPVQSPNQQGPQHRPAGRRTAGPLSTLGLPLVLPEAPRCSRHFPPQLSFAESVTNKWQPLHSKRSPPPHTRGSEAPQDTGCCFCGPGASADRGAGTENKRAVGSLERVARLGESQAKPGVTAWTITGRGLAILGSCRPEQRRRRKAVTREQGERAGSWTRRWESSAPTLTHLQVSLSAHFSPGHRVRYSAHGGWTH